MCKNGFLEIYKNNASEQKLRNVTASPESPDYAAVIAQCLPKNGKPSAAHAVVTDMISNPEKVPKIFRFAIYKAAALGRRKL